MVDVLGGIMLASFLLAAVSFGLVAVRIVFGRGQPLRHGVLMHKVHLRPDDVHVVLDAAGDVLCVATSLR